MIGGLSWGFSSLGTGLVNCAKSLFKSREGQDLESGLPLIENINKDSKKYFNLYKIMLDNTIEKKEIALQLKNKYCDIMNDINEIMNETIKLKYNRFLQRFCYNKIFTPDMCRFIINVRNNKF